MWLPQGASGSSNGIYPSAVFAQAGIAEQRTDAYVFGATWGWPWSWSGKRGFFGGYIEGAVGRWQTHGQAGQSAEWRRQLGTTPLLRFHPDASAWFLDVGVGANYIVPIFQASLTPNCRG